MSKTSTGKNRNTSRATAAVACALGLLLANACGHNGVDEDVVLLDDASDEVLLTLIDAEALGDILTDDDRADRLTAPGDGEVLPASTPTTIAWEDAVSTLKHGRNTGDFTWVQLLCNGADAVHVLAIETKSWQVDSERWDKLTQSSGACTVTITSAFFDRGIIEEGPFRPSLTSAFTIQP